MLQIREDNNVAHAEATHIVFLDDEGCETGKLALGPPMRFEGDVEATICLLLNRATEAMRARV